MRHWHRIAINIIVATCSIVALDLVADYLVAKETEIHPASSRPTLLAVELPAKRLNSVHLSQAERQR